MELTKIEIINIDELRITIDNHKKINKNAILENNEYSVKFAFELTYKKIFSIESVVYVESNFYSTKAFLKRVDIYRDLNGIYLSSNFIQSKVDFHCRKEVCSYYLESYLRKR